MKRKTSTSNPFLCAADFSERNTNSKSEQLAKQLAKQLAVQLAKQLASFFQLEHEQQTTNNRQQHLDIYMLSFNHHPPENDAIYAQPLATQNIPVSVTTHQTAGSIGKN